MNLITIQIISNHFICKIILKSIFKKVNRIKLNWTCYAINLITIKLNIVILNYFL